MLVDMCLVMQITMNVTTLYYTVNSISATSCVEVTSNPPRDLHPKTTYIKELKLTPKDMDPSLDQNWFHKATTPANPDIMNQENELLQPPHVVTKIAKTLSYGFQPYFEKGYFEPFETRPKPITLVAFKKNGLPARKVVEAKKILSALDVAEMQSPYNNKSSH